jgi:hypothetical protein
VVDGISAQPTMGVYPPRGFLLRIKFANETLCAARLFSLDVTPRVNVTHPEAERPTFGLQKAI